MLSGRKVFFIELILLAFGSIWQQRESLFTNTSIEDSSKLFCNWKKISSRILGFINTSSCFSRHPSIVLVFLLPNMEISSMTACLLQVLYDYYMCNRAILPYLFAQLFANHWTTLTRTTTLLFQMIFWMKSSSGWMWRFFVSVLWCKNWRHQSSTDQLWEPLFKRHFESLPKRERMSYKQSMQYFSGLGRSFEDPNLWEVISNLAPKIGYNLNAIIEAKKKKLVTKSWKQWSKSWRQSVQIIVSIWRLAVDSIWLHLYWVLIWPIEFFVGF